MMNGLTTQAYIVLGVYVVLFIFAFIKARKDRIRNITNNSKKRILNSNINIRPQQKRYNTSYSNHNTHSNHSGYNPYSK